MRCNRSRLRISSESHPPGVDGKRRHPALRRAVAPSRVVGQLEAVVTGHDFSRAASAPKSTGALAPEGQFCSN